VNRYRSMNTILITIVLLSGIVISSFSVARARGGDSAESDISIEVEDDEQESETREISQRSESEDRGLSGLVLIPLFIFRPAYSKIKKELKK